MGAANATTQEYLRPAWGRLIFGSQAKLIAYGQTDSRNLLSKCVCPEENNTPPQIARELDRGGNTGQLKAIKDFLDAWALEIKQKLETGQDAFATQNIYIHLGSL